MAQEVDAGIPLNKIVSSGQTGIDRAALDAALALGIPCDGAPRGGGPRMGASRRTIQSWK